jgi:AcrR family transcriptional regulator
MLRNKRFAVEKSREWLIESLTICLKKMKFSDITISDISKKAGVSRRTFYRNFSSKDDLLAEVLNTFFDDYSKNLSAEKKLTYSTITRVCLKHFSENSDLLKALNESGLSYLFFDTMNKKIPEIYNLVKNNSDEYGNRDERKYVLAFSIGGFFNTLVLWMNEGCEKNVDDIATILGNALQTIVKNDI